MSGTIPNDVTLKTAIVAGGCFWCVEADIKKLHGVTAAFSGYIGGTTENPMYENYSLGGHREAVEITYNPLILSYKGPHLVFCHSH